MGPFFTAPVLSSHQGHQGWQGTEAATVVVRCEGKKVFLAGRWRSTWPQRAPGGGNLHSGSPTAGLQSRKLRPKERGGSQQSRGRGWRAWAAAGPGGLSLSRGNSQLAEGRVVGGVSGLQQVPNKCWLYDFSINISQ